MGQRFDFRDLAGFRDDGANEKRAERHAVAQLHGEQRDAKAQPHDGDQQHLVALELRHVVEQAGHDNEPAHEQDAGEPFPGQACLFKRLFGDFATSRGDLVFSKTGELLGIMVNSDYCVLLGNFTPTATITTGDEKQGQRTASLIDSLSARVMQMPVELQ